MPRLVTRILQLASIAAVVVCVGIAINLGSPASNVTPQTEKDATSGLVRIEPAELMAEVDEDATHVNFHFRIVNNSSEVVTIEATKPLCSCTVADLSQSQIPPLESASFHVQYALGDQFGVLAGREIKFLTDQKTSREISCRIGGVRRRNFVSEPAELNFGRVITGEVASQIVTVRSERFTLSPDSIHTSDARLSVTDLSISSQDGTTNLQLRINFASDLSTGLFEGFVTIPGVNPTAPVATIPVRAMVAGPVQLVPQVAFFGVVTPGDTASRTIRAEPTGVGTSKAASIIAIKSLPDLYQYSIHADDSSIILSLDTTAIPTGYLQEELEVVCLYDEKEYTLRLPVRAMLRRREQQPAAQ